MGIQPFGETAQGQKAVLVTIVNQAGMRADITNFGASLVSLLVPDQQGDLADVCLGFDSLSDYMTRSGHLGATVGRFANRIGGASFVLNGQRYLLYANNHGNTLHGGKEGFAKKFWDYRNPASNRAVFTYQSPHMEEGFPGTLQAEVTYSLTDDGGLQIDYRATTDRDTVINLTNHAYFNLAGQGTIHEHSLQVHADHVLEVKEDLIPTGRLMPVEGTPFDLRSTQPLGQALARRGEHPMFDGAGGFDTAYVIKGSGLREAAVLLDMTSKRRMRVITDQPGMQVYSGQGLKGPGKGGALYQPFSGIALETQHHPDSVNLPNLPTTILRQGDTFRSTSIYRFETI